MDADTEVMPDSLNRLVACMVADSKVIGLCGETQVANEDRSFTTMIQVYEYYISHHLAKSFESLFGSVTCLPGCFSMYRILTIAGKPLIISNKIVHDYSHNDVDTLHKKNLLHLGEDRYLTTLMMKYFPNYKLKFTPDATCKTVAPDRWRVLLSQRRRWINSTIHNLGELMVLSELCGFCCFSMRFIVLVDLLGTLILPASFVYLVYLIIVVATHVQPLPIVAVAILAAVYGLQALIFILKGAWQHIGWMIIYIIAMPFFSVFIPLYSFWHFDDFSWGNTRQVVGADGKKMVMAAEAQTRFDPNSIPLKSLEAYEAERLMMMNNGSVIGGGYYMDGNGSVVGSNYQDETGSVMGRYDHAGMVAGGGYQSNQYSKLDSLYGRSGTPSPLPHQYDGGSVVGGDNNKSVYSGYGGGGGFGEEVLHDYYRDSNAIQLNNPGRHSRVPSQIPTNFLPGSAGGRPRSTSPLPPASGGNESPFVSYGGGPFMDPQNRVQQRSSMLSSVSHQPGMIELNQFSQPPATMGLGMTLGTPLLNASQLPQQQFNPQLEQQMLLQQQFLQQQSALATSSPVIAPMIFTPSSSPLPTIQSGDSSAGATDADIQAHIRRLLTGVDLMTVTKKKIRTQLEGILGMDLSSRRDFVSRAIDAELQILQQQHPQQQQKQSQLPPL